MALKSCAVWLQAFRLSSYSWCSRDDLKINGAKGQISHTTSWADDQTHPQLRDVDDPLMKEFSYHTYLNYQQKRWGHNSCWSLWITLKIIRQKNCRYVMYMNKDLRTLTFSSNYHLQQTRCLRSDCCNQLQ